jgi:hypothetical protein
MDANIFLTSLNAGSQSRTASCTPDADSSAMSFQNVFFCKMPKSPAVVQDLYLPEPEEI